MAFRFDATIPDAERAAEANAARLITEVTDETREAIRALIARAIREGVPPYDAARQIREMIGLHSRQMGAVWRFREELINSGLALDKVEKRVARLIKKKLRERAEMISRTETLKALNEGQAASWRAAQKDGLLGKDAVKEWITTPDENLCPVCEPLDGQKVPLGEKFDTANGAIETPPAHPRCRCAMGIGKGSQTGVASESAAGAAGQSPLPGGMSPEEFYDSFDPDKNQYKYLNSKEKALVDDATRKLFDAAPPNLRERWYEELKRMHRQQVDYPVIFESSYTGRPSDGVGFVFDGKAHGVMVNRNKAPRHLWFNLNNRYVDGKWVKATADELAQTMAHEMAHVLDVTSGRYDVTWGLTEKMVGDGIWDAVQEIDDDAFWYARTSPKEGFAELVRMYLTGSRTDVGPGLSASEFRNRYPDLARWVKSVLGDA